MQWEGSSVRIVGTSLAGFLMALLITNSGMSQPSTAPASDRPGTAPAALSNTSVPKILKARWQSVSPNEAISSVSVDWDGQTLKYELTRPPSVAIMSNDLRAIRPSDTAWKEFAQSLEKEQVWNWAGEYPAQPGSDDGRLWSVEIEWGTKAVKSRGAMGYPTLRNVSVPTGGQVMLRRLWYALDQLSATPVEVEGQYFAGFEASQFRPFTSPYAGKLWWLTPNEDFSARYAKLTPDGDATYRFSGPNVIAKVRGRLVGPGEYGHLGAYEYEFLVEQVQEMKEASR